MCPDSTYSLTSSAATMVFRSLSDPMMIPICGAASADSASDLPDVDASWERSGSGCLSAEAEDASLTPVIVTS